MIRQNYNTRSPIETCFATCLRFSPGTSAGFDDDGTCGFGVECVAESLATLFAEDNRWFDRERFLAACGVQA
jgi:hypothetical protein